MDESRSARNIGLVLMGFGLLLNPLFIGWAVSPSGSVERAPTLIFIIFAELFLVSAGGFFVIRKASLRGKTAWFSLVLFVIIPPAVEIGLQGLRLAQHLLRPAALDKRMALSAYRDKPWGRELFREMHELTFVYKQYLGWRTKEYHGVWINVDGDGLRRTTGGFPEDGQDQARVYMFGGSSMWGAYARDGNTIPSLLSRRAREAGVRVRFSNFAEQGYTFTQEVLRLLLLIREGKTPDGVVFYDGFNDVVTAETSGRPGSTSLTAQFEELVESRHMGFLKQIGWAAHALITQECMLYKSAESLAALAGLRDRKSVV
jgi:hypothetical protein